MSGIIGVWNSQKPTPWQSMLNDLLVLGGDATGDWHDRKVGLSLGRTQFFNTPESCYEQPVVEFDGCVLVWDGRLDDRKTLLGSRYDRLTDAQLLIESYRRWGVDCIQHLTGEFVFILWDAVKETLLVGCDVVGRRSVAYFWDGQTLLLSSRLVTLLLHPQVSKRLDEVYLAHTLCRLQSHPPGITPFADVKRLVAGSALILKSGVLQQRQIANLRIPLDRKSPKLPEIQEEKFAYLLNQAILDRLRSHRPIATTLSGGLDSTTITAYLLNHLTSVDSFSTVTEVYPEFDERQPIKSFLERYPQIKWHPVNNDLAWSLSESWSHLPVTDDPLVTCTLPMNINLMQQMQNCGIGLVFDGEGGDEIYSSNLQDLALVGSWVKLIAQLKGNKRWHSELWWDLLLPRSPKFLQSLWFVREQRKPDFIAPWLLRGYTQTPGVKQAIEQYKDRVLACTGVEKFNWSISSGFSVGASQVYKLIELTHGLQSTSPFLDKRVVEFALNLHPDLVNHPVHGKIFLRQANRHTLPEDVLWRPKSNYFDPLKYAGIGKGDRALQLLEQLKDMSLLQEIIDVNLISDLLQSYRTGYAQSYSPGKPYRNNLANWLYELLSFVNWYGRIESKYLTPITDQLIVTG